MAAALGTAMTGLSSTYAKTSRFRVLLSAGFNKAIKEIVWLLLVVAFSGVTLVFLIEMVALAGPSSRKKAPVKVGQQGLDDSHDSSLPTPLHAAGTKPQPKVQITA